MRQKRITKRQRKFAATCRVLHVLRREREDDTLALDDWMVAASGPVQ